MGKQQPPIKGVEQRKYTPFHPKFYSKFYKGLLEAFVGLSRAIRSPYVRGAYKKFFLQTLLIFIITYIFALIFYCVPFRLVSSLLGWEDETESIEISTMKAVGFSVAHFYFIFVELFAYTTYEKLFFQTLSLKNPQLSEYIQGRERMSQFRAVMKVVKRSLYFLFLGSILTILSYIPTVGYFVFPAASVILNMRVVGKEVAILFGALSLIPQVNPYSGMVLKMMMVSYSTSRHMLFPYTLRLKSSVEYQYLMRRYFGTLLGFSLPYALLMYIPVVGLFVFPLSQAACATLILNILGRNRLKEKAIPLPGEEFVEAQNMSFGNLSSVSFEGLKNETENIFKKKKETDE